MIQDLIRDIPDFPEPGVVFKDITPVLASPETLHEVIEALIAPFRASGVDKVVGIESRGFILGTPAAMSLGAGFVPVRKPGKLPAATLSEEYSLEYGTDALEIHVDAFEGGERVLVVDDVLATGGTAAATCRLIEKAGGHVLGLSILIELAFLGGRAQLNGQELHTLVVYD